MKKLIAMLFFLFMLLVAYWANTNRMPELLKVAMEFPYSDKLGHFILYGILAYLLTVAMPFRWVKILRWNFPLGAVLAVVFATLEEISQLFFVTRSASFVDLFSGYSGIMAAMICIPCLRNAYITNTEK